MNVIKSLERYRVGARLARFALPCCVGLALVLPPSTQASLGLQQAIDLARANDPWLQGSQYRQQALEQLGAAATSLPDPVFRLGIANLPTDTFEFNQEPMTQLQVGVSQVIPPGDSRALQQRQLEQQGSRLPFERAQRRARLAVEVAAQWLESYRARESIRLIEQDRELFEQLADVARSSYTAVLGTTRQQDLVRAQLELTRLEDRLVVLQQHRDTADAALGEWLAGTRAVSPGGYELPAELPRLDLLQPQLASPDREVTEQELAAFLSTHPALQGLERNIAAGDTAVELARQQYRPQWRIDASYGYRDDDPAGPSRADFFSLGVGVQMPLFSSHSQDRQLQSALASAEALRTEKSLALRRMMADFTGRRARLHYLERRRALYQSRLLREMAQQADASLAAYTNDTGDFAEVVRAHIAVLNARIEALDIEVERLKTVSELNYFFAAGPVCEGETP